MSAKRVRIGLDINGKDQWYQREAEVLDAQTKKYVVKPYFVLAKREAQIMSEDVRYRTREEATCSPGESIPGRCQQ